MERTATGSPALVTLIWILVLLLVITILAYRGVRLLPASLVAAAVVTGYTIHHNLVHPGVTGPIVMWTLFAVPALALNLVPLRRRLLTLPVLKAFRRMMPEMSDTEREALEAGTVWWEGELFSGMPRWDKLLSLPGPRLSTEEQAFLDGPVQALCRMLDEWKITHEWCDLSPEIWEFLRAKGFFAMIIPREYGGLGFPPWPILKCWRASPVTAPLPPPSSPCPHPWVRVNCWSATARRRRRTITCRDWPGEKRFPASA
jgi:acyl-CoA dehydrogenase